jgi:hypothetical protein
MSNESLLNEWESEWKLAGLKDWVSAPLSGSRTSKLSRRPSTSSAGSSAERRLSIWETPHGPSARLSAHSARGVTRRDGGWSLVHGFIIVG